MNIFEMWFFKVLLPHVNEQGHESETVVVMGSNLASNFLPEVISVAKETLRKV